MYNDKCKMGRVNSEKIDVKQGTLLRVLGGLSRRTFSEGGSKARVEKTVKVQ
jgi:hypothetical protein